jgi:hypothetical protein
MSDYQLNPTYDSNSPTGMYIPADVEDCIREMNKVLPAALLDKIRTSEEHDLALFHFGLGMWMRNSWGLWMDESRLRRYFVGLGVPDADDMTGIIIGTYWDVLNGRPADVRRRIVYNKIDKDQIRGGIKPSN